MKLMASPTLNYASSRLQPSALSASTGRVSPAHTLQADAQRSGGRGINLLLGISVLGTAISSLVLSVSTNMLDKEVHTIKKPVLEKTLFNVSEALCSRKLPSGQNVFAIMTSKNNGKSGYTSRVDFLANKGVALSVDLAKKSFQVGSDGKRTVGIFDRTKYCKDGELNSKIFADGAYAFTPETFNNNVTTVVNTALKSKNDPFANQTKPNLFDSFGLLGTRLDPIYGSVKVNQNI